MLVNKFTKSVEDISDYKYNWIDDNWIYVETGSELAEKIIENAPFMELIFDDEGSLIDVVPTQEGIDIRLSNGKCTKIAESKIALAEWFETHPYQHTDGKYYSCTEEKQSLLNGNLASYERATQAGISYPLKWNSTGDECLDWSYEDLVTLSLSIAGYVAPKVSMQQAYELQIKACVTLEDLEKIVIAYE